MVKGYDYYMDLDLDAVAKTIPVDRAGRLRSAALGDIITAIYYRAKEQIVEPSRLLQLLGAPDRIRAGNLQEVWEYDWIGKHGEDEYQSQTSFRIVSNRVAGIEKPEILRSTAK